MKGNRYEPVIGLEVHAQLLTRSKIFCGCPATYGAEPNTMVCPVCLGLPGALPVLNREAVSMAVKMALVTNCRIAPRSAFARKNYFYPDCPKNYQISMYDRPLCGDGYIEIGVNGETRRIGIERIHLEDDAGKLVHDPGGASRIDFNRCGIPLVEIVTRPDIRSSAEAGMFLVRLRQIMRYLGVCNGNMEQGSLRCDVNISLRPAGSTELGTKTEIKNLNSFKAVEMGIRYEIERQAEVIEGGGAVSQVTNLWDEAGRRLVTMRSKEHAHDYRYFPEPDLPTLMVDDAWIEEVRRTIPELPIEREQRFREAYGLPAYDAGVLSAERGIADYFEAVVAAANDPKASAKWVMREVLGELKGLDAGIKEFPVAPDRLGELIRLVGSGVISGSAGSEVFAVMVRSGQAAPAVVRRLGLTQISDEAALQELVELVLSDHPEEVERYRAGKTQLLGYFVGQVMKRSGGKANPNKTGEILRRVLGSDHHAGQ